jgi:NADH-quinone oxidoreductase subunit D
MNGHGWAMAVEKLLDVKCPPRADAIRVILSEFSRIMDHIVCIGANLVDLGGITPMFVMFRAREVIYDLIEACCGARLTVSYVRIGGLADDVPADFDARCKAALEACRTAIDDGEKLVTRNPIFVGRFKDIGVMSKEDALSWGWVGPALRGSGVAYDVRKDHPYSGYEQYDFDVPVGTVGDCYDRYLVRMEEMRQSVRLVHQCLDKIPGGFENKSKEPVNVADGKIVLPPKNKVMSSMEELIHQFILVTQGMNCPPGEIYFGHENPKGELGFYINSKGGGVPHRLKIRAPSFVNLSILPELLPGCMISDVVAVLGSLDFVMGECDR